MYIVYRRFYPDNNNASNDDDIHFPGAYIYNMHTTTIT